MRHRLGVGPTSVEQRARRTGGGPGVWGRVAIHFGKGVAVSIDDKVKRHLPVSGSVEGSGKPSSRSGMAHRGLQELSMHIGTLVLALIVLYAPLAVDAQQVSRVATIAVLSGGGPGPSSESFRHALRDLGWA